MQCLNLKKGMYGIFETFFEVFLNLINIEHVKYKVRLWQNVRI